VSEAKESTKYFLLRTNGEAKRHPSRRKNLNNDSVEAKREKKARSIFFCERTEERASASDIPLHMKKQPETLERQQDEHKSRVSLG